MKLLPLLMFVLAVLGFQSGENPADKSASGRQSPGKSVSGKSAVGKSAADEGAPDKNLPAQHRMEAESTLVTIIEEVEIPAKVEGVLSSIDVKEGDMVESQAVLARIEDGEARLTHDRAAIEFEIARKQAKNDLKVRISKKAADVARTELRRGLDSNAVKKNAVSEAEIDRLRLAADKTELEIEQAVHEQETAELTSRLKETEMKLAQQAVDRRAIVSPISGMVVQVNSQRGEWVPAGKTVVRVLRLDRLRVEGFVQSKHLNGNLVGRKATLTVDLPDQPAREFIGTVVFVSPEIDPVNQTVRVWAEIDNSELLLRPGLRGKVTIHSEKTTEAARRER
ncbi:MAG TPA: efflux RND transporter periplasmic adaptor subunit [Planctomycetaceae bacterium]|jgi:macrolide-specific efflux system membrane fusion protein